MKEKVNLKVIASWDDGTTADLKMAELMLKYDIPTIFYWPSYISRGNELAMTSSWLSEKQCKEIASQFEIGSHSVSDVSMKKMQISQISREINDSKKHWQDVTGQPINSFAYPKNSMNSLMKALLKGAGYTSARANFIGFLNSGDDPFESKCTVQIGMDRIDYNNKCWELFAEEMIAKANENSIFHIFGNPWDIETFGDWENLENLLKILTGR
jgi:peptidoglycan/xylan/chitin deacetylase (PgdA/CDA1 family)